MSPPESVLGVGAYLVRDGAHGVLASMGEITLAAASEKRAQLVPNWEGIMMPVTTPMAKETAKMRIRNCEIRSQISSRWKK